MNNSEKKLNSKQQAQKVTTNMQNVVIERFKFIVGSFILLWCMLKIVEYNYNIIPTLVLMPNIMLGTGVVFLIITGVIYVICFKKRKLNQAIAYIALSLFISIYGFTMGLLKYNIPIPNRIFGFQFAALFLYLIIGCAYSAFKYYIITYKRK